MKNSFKMALLTVTVGAFLFIVLMTSCQSPGQTPGGGDLSPSLRNKLGINSLIDSNGNKTTPHIIVQSSSPIPAGSQLIVTCATKDCVPSAGSGTTAGGSRVLFVGTILQDIPENAELVIRIAAKGDSALVSEVIKAR
jgi:hypothetical protein